MFDLCHKLKIFIVKRSMLTFIYTISGCFSSLLSLQSLPLVSATPLPSPVASPEGRCRWCTSSPSPGLLWMFSWGATMLDQSNYVCCFPSCDVSPPSSAAHLVSWCVGCASHCSILWRWLGCVTCALLTLSSGAICSFPPRWWRCSSRPTNQERRRSRWSPG